MNSIIESRREAIEKLCIKFSVKRLELFGSATRGEFQSGLSDLDFLVEFESLDYAKHADAYFDLKEELEKLFGCDVDLVETKAIKNPYFLESVNVSRLPVYAA